MNRLDLGYYSHINIADINRLLKSNMQVGN